MMVIKESVVVVRGTPLGRKIRALRERAGASQAIFADTVGVSQPTVSRWETGEDEPDKASLIRLAQLAGQTPAEFQYGPAGAQLGQIPVEIAGYVGAGSEIYPIDDLGAGLDQVDVPPLESRAIVAVIVRGDSMLPAYRDGDVIYYSRDRDLLEEAFLRRECVVKLADERVFIKTVVRGSVPGTYTLLSYNAEPIADQPIEWAAPIAWVKKSTR
ncbi:MAG: helix-turn-helix domain-containing protein [Alphaproteobacteria bacterium]